MDGVSVCVRVCCLSICVFVRVFAGGVPARVWVWYVCLRACAHARVCKCFSVNICYYMISRVHVWNSEYSTVSKTHTRNNRTFPILSTLFRDWGNEGRKPFLSLIHDLLPCQSPAGLTLHKMRNTRDKGRYRESYKLYTISKLQHGWRAANILSAIKITDKMPDYRRERIGVILLLNYKSKQSMRAREMSVSGNHVHCTILSRT